VSRVSASQDALQAERPGLPLSQQQQLWQIPLPCISLLLPGMLGKFFEPGKL